MKKNIFIVAAAALAMMATSCTKENENPQDEVKQIPITITAGYEGGNAKVQYNESGSNITATWESGDKILVVYDGHVSELSLSSGAGTDNGTFSGTISYTHTPSANSMLSCYVKDAKNPGMVIDNGDGTIVYSNASFLTQDGSMDTAASRNTYFGMATYGDGSNIRCSFSVNTSMCKFNITDVGGDAGNSATVEYKSNGTTVAKATITVSSGDNLVYLAVPAGGYSGVQKVVYTCATSSTVKEYTLSSTQATFVAGHTYSKELWLVPRGALTGLFSVSADKQVYFSQGNLQYQASTNTWRFAEHQNDFVGDNTNGNVYVNAVKCNNSNISSSYDGWIDLFGWAMSGYNHNPTNTPYPWRTDEDDAFYWAYGNSRYNLYDGNGQADWGYNAISNGGNRENIGWRTLTKNESMYLFYYRADAESKYGYGKVNDVKGLIILPDVWAQPDGLSFTPGISNWSNVYTTEQWALMEANGAVFLPAAGHRDGDNTDDVMDKGLYWSSSYSGEYKAIYLHFFYNSDGLDPVYQKNRHLGLSVRLVFTAE